jgi:hypothetical protein
MRDEPDFSTDDAQVVAAIAARVTPFGQFAAKQ